jgi:hypothetical protein
MPLIQNSGLAGNKPQSATAEIPPANYISIANRKIHYQLMWFLYWVAS